MLKWFVYVSSDETDKCSIVNIFAKTIKCADKLANKKFSEWGYKGKPQLLAI